MIFAFQNDDLYKDLWEKVMALQDDEQKDKFLQRKAVVQVGL
jgi:hypothetical protein